MQRKLIISSCIKLKIVSSKIKKPVVTHIFHNSVVFQKTQTQRKPMQRLQKAIYQPQIVPQTLAHAHRRSPFQMQAVSPRLHRRKLPKQPHAHAHPRRAKTARMRDMQKALHSRDVAKQAHAEAFRGKAVCL